MDMNSEKTGQLIAESKDNQDAQTVSQKETTPNQDNTTEDTDKIFELIFKELKKEKYSITNQTFIQKDQYDKIIEKTTVSTLMNKE